MTDRSNSRANAINNAGQIAGTTGGYYADLRAFLYQNGTTTDDGPVVKFGFDRGEGPNSINQAGQMQARPWTTIFTATLMSLRMAAESTWAPSPAA